MAFVFSKGKKNRRGIGFLDGANGPKQRSISPFVPTNNKGIVGEYLVGDGAFNSTHMLDQHPKHNGTRRTGEEGRCYTADGTDDEVNYGDIGSAIWFSGWVKLNSDDQCLFSLSNDTNTNLIVSSGVLTAGATLTLEGIKVDNVSKTASEAGALLNDNLWHFLSCGIGDGLGGASTADDVRYFTDGTNHGSVSGFDWRFWATAPTADELSEAYSGETANRNSASLSKYALWSKMDEQDGTTSYDSSGNDLTGTITNATLATFHATHDIWSFQNQVGYNKRMRFDGTSNYVDLANLYLLLNPSSFSMTIKEFYLASASITTRSIIFSTRLSASGLNIAVSNAYNFQIFEGGFPLGAFTSYTVPQKQKIKLQVSINATIAKLFIDNVLIEEITLSSGCTISSKSEIGAFSASSVYYFNGVLSGISFFSDDAFSTSIAVYDGYGNTNEDWIDQIGSNNGTVNGSPSNILLPRDESDPTNDVLGNPLTYTGQRPNDFKLTGSNCLTLNGTNQAVIVDDNTSLDITDNITVMVWVKYNGSNITSPKHFIAKYDIGSNGREWLMYFDTSEKLNIAFGDPVSGAFEGGVFTDDAITVDSNNLYAFSFASGTLKIYVNGISVPYSVFSGSIPTSLYNGSANLSIGCSLSSNTPSNAWDGQTFEARVYSGESTVLTDAEILSIYQNPSSNINFDGQTLAARYKLAEGAGTICYDSSGNNNHGTILNAASNWGVTQDLVHSNLLEGHSVYEHASSDLIRVPFGSDGHPLSITPPAGYSKTSDNPSGDYHNNAETLIDFDPDSTPEMNNIYLESVFNGSTSNGYVTNDSVLNFTDNLTVSCWAKSDLTDITSSADTLVSMYEDTGNLEVWRMEISTDEKLRFQVGNSGGTGATIETTDSAYPIDTWTHYAATFDGGVVNLYINGELQSSSESSAHATSLNGRSAPLVLGAYFWTGGGGSFGEWDGSLRNIRVYKGDSAPLDNSQIVRDLMETETQPRFDGQTVIASYDLVKDTLDRSGNGLHADNSNISFTKKTVPSSYSFGDDLGRDGIISKTVEFDDSNWGSIFDGSSEIVVGNREKLKIKSSPFEIEASVKTTDTGDNTILSKFQTSGNLRSYSLNIESGKIVFDSSSNGSTVVSATGSIDVNDGSWHTIRVQRESESGTSIKMYVDGTEDTGVAGSLAANFSDNISNVAIGAYNTDATSAYVFTGNLRDLRVKTNEVEVAHWELAKDTRDSSPNNYHGTNDGVTFLKPNREHSITVSDRYPLGKPAQFLKQYNKSKLRL